MALGYWNKVLRVDLTSKKIIKEEIDDEACKLFLGGAGIGVDGYSANTPRAVKLARKLIEK